MVKQVIDNLPYEDGDYVLERLDLDKSSHIRLFVESYVSHVNKELKYGVKPAIPLWHWKSFAFGYEMRNEHLADSWDYLLIKKFVKPVGFAEIFATLSGEFLYPCFMVLATDPKDDDFVEMHELLARFIKHCGFSRCYCGLIWRHPKKQLLRLKKKMRDHSHDAKTPTLSIWEVDLDAY